MLDPTRVLPLLAVDGRRDELIAVVDGVLWVNWLIVSAIRDPLQIPSDNTCASEKVKSEAHSLKIFSRSSGNESTKGESFSCSALNQVV